MVTVGLQATGRAWARLVAIGSGCSKCPIAARASKHVFGRGSLAAKTIFIGYGPGLSEDALGVPFVGPAGKLLDAAVKAAFHLHNRQPSVFFTNLLRCRPCDTLGGPNRDPVPDEVDNCWPLLTRTLEIVNPHVVFLLGRVTHYEFGERWLRSETTASPVAIVEVTHPASVVRRGGVEGTAFTAYVRSIFEGLEVLYCG